MISQMKQGSKLFLQLTLNTIHRHDLIQISLFSDKRGMHESWAGLLFRLPILPILVPLMAWVNPYVVEIWHAPSVLSCLNSWSNCLRSDVPATARIQIFY